MVAHSTRRRCGFLFETQLQAGGIVVRIGRQGPAGAQGVGSMTGHLTDAAPGASKNSATCR